MSLSLLLCHPGLQCGPEILKPQGEKYLFILCNAFQCESSDISLYVCFLLSLYTKTQGGITPIQGGSERMKVLFVVLRSTLSHLGRFLSSSLFNALLREGPTNSKRRLHKVFRKEHPGSKFFIFCLFKSTALMIRRALSFPYFRQEK